MQSVNSTLLSAKVQAASAGHIEKCPQVQPTSSNQESELLYGVEDRPPLIMTIILALQHVLAAFAGIVAVPLVVCATLKFDVTQTAIMVSATIFVSGLTTLLQSKGLGPIGSRLPAMMGTDFTFVNPAISVGAKFGIPGIVGATDYGSLRNLLVAFVIMLFTLFLNHYGKGLMKTAAVFVGIVFGYIICLPLDMVDLSSVYEANWIALPGIFRYGIHFDLASSLAFVPAYIVSTIGTVGIMLAIGAASNTKVSSNKSAGAVLCDGLGSLLAGVFGAGPNTSFSQNVGLITLTKVASVNVMAMAGVILMILGVFPKLSALIAVMPQPVLGGVGVIMFGLVAAQGIKTLATCHLGDRELLIISVAFALGIGVTVKPEILASLPTALKMILASGISTGTLAALILNIVLVPNRKGNRQ